MLLHSLFLFATFTAILSAPAAIECPDDPLPGCPSCSPTPMSDQVFDAIQNGVTITLDLQTVENGECPASGTACTSKPCKWNLKIAVNNTTNNPVNVPIRWHDGSGNWNDWETVACPAQSTKNSSAQNFSEACGQTGASGTTVEVRIGAVTKTQTLGCSGCP